MGARTLQLLTVCAAVAVHGLPASAQDASKLAESAAQMAPGDVASAVQSAIGSLPSAAQDKLLVKDLLGAKISGPGGSTIGTVENFVVIPGGRVVAAIVSTQDAGRIPVPFSVVKIGHSAGKLDLSLPVSLSELKGMGEIQKLADALPGMG